MRLRSMKKRGGLNPIDRKFLTRSQEGRPNPRSAPIRQIFQVPTNTNKISVCQRRSGTPVCAPLLDVLSTRRSRRRFRSISSRRLSDLLFHSARVRSSWDGSDGYRLSSRPAPSAGARHPIEILGVFNQVQGIPRGLWHFDPFGLELRCVSARPREIARYNKSACAVLGTTTAPPVIFLFVAVLQRTLSRYPAGLSLIWRDSGALAATIALAAEGIGLAACPLGFSQPFHSPASIGIRMHAGWIMGGIAIGERDLTDS